jgi:hypothetical protein
MRLYPINKFVVLEPIEEKIQSAVLLPEGFMSKSETKIFRTITVSKGSDLPEGCLVAVLSNMVNKITCDGNTYLTVPESAIIGYFAGI